MKTIRKHIFAILPFAAMLAMAMAVSCTKENPQTADTVQGASSGSTSNPSGDDTPVPVENPSKYSPDELVTVRFTADAEGTRTSIGEPGSGAGGTGRSITWNLGDQVTFVWGPDAEDRVVGTADEISEDGKRATFTVEKVYTGAKAIYAIYPAGAFYSFTKGTDWETDGTGTVRVSIGQMADGTRVDGSFAQADVCLARTSLETHKMKFKHLVSFITMTSTQSAARGVRLDAGSIAVSGILPVEATVGADGYTQTVTPGAAESTATSVTVDAQAVGQLSWIPVLPGLSFAEGVNLSFLDGNDGAIGSATMRNATTVALGSMLNFSPTLNTKFARDFYVKSTADGAGDGTSWDSPWTAAQLAGYLAAAHSETGLSSSATINFHIAAGTYNQSFTPASQTLPDAVTPRPLNFICGYPSGITVANAASNPPDPSRNATVFSGEGLSSGVWKFCKTNTFSINGMTVSGYVGTTTNDTAFALYSDEKEAVYQTVRGTMTDCVFSDNDNTKGAVFHVSAAVSIYWGAVAVFNRCTFSGNLASAGAALNTDSNAEVTLNDCLFSGNLVALHQGNNAQDCGGAVKVSSGATLVANNTVFSGNGVVAAATVGYGGALWIESAGCNVTINGGSFTGNYVANPAGKGGAVFLQGGTLNLNGVTFRENACTAAATTTGGGAVFIGYDSYKSGNNVVLNATDCTFDGNLLAERGDDNDTAAGGGAFYIDPAADKTVSCNFSGTTFSNHILNNMHGGVFYVTGGTLDFAGCTFEGNDTRWTYTGTPASGKILNQGSVMTNYGANCTFRDSTVFLSNVCTSGGVLYLPDAATGGYFHVDKCRFHQNSSTGSGTVFRMPKNDGNSLVVSNSRFTRNTSSASGAVAAVFKNTEATFSNCTFEYNTAASFGGCIYVGGETSFSVSEVKPVTVSDCVFNHNNASGGGGAIEVSNAGCDGTDKTCNSDIEILRCTFTDNSSVAYGGAVGIRSCGNASVRDCVFTGNYTTKLAGTGSGGALSVRDGNKSGYTGNVTVSGCSFADNHTATDGTNFNTIRGGALQINAYGSDASMDIRMDKCVFVNNYATQGGAVRCHGSASGQYRLFVNDCVFEKNHIAAGYGTTLRADGCRLCMNNCTLHDSWTENRTGKYGCWVDICDVSGVFSSNTLIGQAQRSSGDTGTTMQRNEVVSYAALVRLDYYSSASPDLHFINNIIAPTQDWVYSFIQNAPKATGYDLNTCFYANKMGPFVPAEVGNDDQSVAITNKGESDGANAVNFKGTASYFGGLSWVAGNPLSRTGTYWYWNGTLATGSPTTKISVETLASRIRTADSDFYAWLSTPGIDGIYMDQRGSVRTSPVATGAFDPGNAGLVTHDDVDDLSRQTVELTD